MNATKTLSRLVPALAILIMVGGCGGDAPDASAPQDEEFGEPTDGGTAVVLIGADMTIPLSMLAQGTIDGNLGGDVMFMELLRGAWEDGRLVFKTAEESPMAIARSYEYVGPDSASLRFHMRPDVTWSDGEPLTADDIVFSYSILGDPALASPMQSYVELIDSVEAENDSTVVFHYSRRHPEMLTHAALPPIPEHIFGDTPPGEIINHPTLRNPADGNLVVSGPFMIDNWERGQSITLIPNPEFEPQPYLDQLVFRVVPDLNTRLVELQTGNADFLQGITFDQVPRIRSQAPHVRLEREEKRFYDYVAYNPEQFEPFANPEVRRALGLAVDVPAMIAALQMDEFAVPAGGPFAPIFEGLYDPDAQAPLPYDPDQARSILESHGWADTNNDGVLDRDGQPFQFTLITNSGNQRRADVSQILEQQWSRLGVDVELRIVEFNTMNDNLATGNFEAALGGWSVGLSPDLTMTPIWSPDSPFNFTGYEDPDVVRLMDQARQQPTYEAASPFWRDAASAIVEDQPYTWLYYMDSVDGVNNRLRGPRIDTYGPYQNTWEWWIPENLR
ncbi:MAG: ABC transporter substrate-binding protein [Gemmatimonadota bacterium]